jgi:ADP-ribose pyrophosphatase YjhB (NUDIX family)
VRRPRVRGVKCIVRDDAGRVLLVRHSYGARDRWELPGGHVRRGEAPERGAHREIAEELGLRVGGWQPAGVLSARTDHKHETVFCFVAEGVTGDLVLADGEVVEARWWAADALPAPLGDVSERALALPGAG